MIPPTNSAPTAPPAKHPSQRLLVVLAFTRSDRDLALNLLTWIEELGGCEANTLMLVADCKLPVDEVEAVAKPARAAFAAVDVVRTPFALKDEKWPLGANWMFETAARRVATHHKCPWLWLEPDAVPMHKGWLAEVEAEYHKAARPFMGQVLRTQQAGVPPVMLSGIAVYPATLPPRFMQRLVSKRFVPWDTLCADLVVTQAQHSTLFWNFLNRAKPPTFVRKREPGHPENALELKQVPARTAIAHTCKDGSLIGLLRGDGEPTIPQLIMAWRNAKEHKGALGAFVQAVREPMRFVHVVERHMQRDADGERRVLQAFQSWVTLYKTGRMRPCHVWQYARDSMSMGDARRLPFLKDVLVEGMTLARRDNDVVVWTNDDTVLHTRVLDAIEAKLATAPACSSFRVNFQQGKMPRLDGDPAEVAKAHTQHGDIGRDLFAFRKHWLRAHWFNMPDFLLGELEFDLVLATMVRRSAGVFTDRKNISQVMSACELERGYLLHEHHERQWTNVLQKRAEAKQYNRSLAVQWYSGNGFPSLISPV